MKKIIAYIFSFVLLFASCKKDDNQDVDSNGLEKIPSKQEYQNYKFDNNPQSLGKNSSKIANKNNQFAFRFLYQSLNTKDDNILISPLSMSIAWAMLQNGANNQTFEEIATALGFENFSKEEINSFFNYLIARLQTADKTVLVNLANAIWFNNEIEVYDSFLKILNIRYDACVVPGDFVNNGPKVVKEINDWCNKQTNGRITDIIDNITPEHLLVLLNAVYYNAKWKEKFNKTLTARRDFTPNGKEVTKADFMIDSRYVSYHKTEEYQAFSLEMGDKSNYSAFFILPLEGVSISDVSASLSKLESFELPSYKLVEMYIPKFEVRYTLGGDNMLNVLNNLGINQAFDRNNADFSNILDISKLNAFVSSVTQKTFFAINEEEVEAAAVTIIEMECNSAAPDQEEVEMPIVIDLNRDFIYGVKENSTNSILFVGVFNKPEVKY